MAKVFNLGPGEAVEALREWVEHATAEELELLRTAIELWPNEARKAKALQMIEEARSTRH